MTAFSEQLLLARGEAPGTAIWLMAIGFTAICIIMMLVVLIQKPKGGGLSGAFGGGAGGGSSTAFVGGGIGNVLTFVTVACFIIFLLLACGMTLAINAGDDVPEADETEQVEDGAGAPDAGDAGTPVTEDEPTEEPASEETAEEEDATEDDAEATEGDAEPTEGEAPQTTEPTE